MGNNQNKFRCIAKPNVDFTKYGFADDKREYSICLGSMKRIIIHKEGIKRVVFNLSTVDSIKLICEMYKDGAISFVPNTKIKRHYLSLSEDEYKKVLEMREKENDKG